MEVCSRVFRSFSLVSVVRSPELDCVCICVCVCVRAMASFLALVFVLGESLNLPNIKFAHL